MLKRAVMTIAIMLLAVPASGRPLAAPAPGGGPVAGFVVVQAGDERPPGPANLREAMEIAQQRYGGRVAGADTVERDGVRVHEIRLLIDDESVRTVLIDPQTGAIIPQERDQG